MLLKLFVLLQGIRSELYQKHSEEIQPAKQRGNSYVHGLLRLGILTARPLGTHIIKGVLRYRGSYVAAILRYVIYSKEFI